MLTLPHVQLIEHAEFFAAPARIGAWIEEFHAPLANLLLMPLVVFVMHALRSDKRTQERYRKAPRKCSGVEVE